MMPDPVSPHIPETQATLPVESFPTNAWQRKLYSIKRWLGRHQLSSEDVSGLIALMSMALIVLLLSSRYLFEDQALQNGVLIRDVYAERTLQVVDDEETQRRRVEAAQSAMPVYKTQTGVDKIIMDRLVNLLESISDVRQQAASPSQKITEIEHLIGPIDRSHHGSLLSTLANSPRWQVIYAEAVQTCDALLKQGINSEDFRLRRDLIISQAIDRRVALSTSEREAIVFLVGLKLRPTLTIDEELTQQSREKASQMVQPVLEVFHKGDLIAHRGEKVNAFQMSALQQQGNLGNRNKWISITGVSILALSLMGIVWGYLYRFEHSHFFKPNFAGLLGTCMLMSVGGLSLFMDFKPSGMAVEDFPIPILSLLLCIFIHPRIAILTTMMVLLLSGLALRIPLESLSVLVIASLVGIFVLARKPVPKDRYDLILSGFSIGVAQALSILAVGFIYSSVLSDDVPFNFLWHSLYGMISGVGTGILTLGVLPLVESSFKLITPYTLLELGNHDRPILKRLQLEAPGTFHHSVMVASLSEAAAEAIAANPILARVGALYHDIGKIKRPLFFIENQSYFGVENPHDKLTPRLSKMVITAHPRDGVEIAKHLNLPDVLMRFMMEHHGTLITGYFFNKAVMQEGSDHVNKNHFRYAGPKPQSKETAIVMLADACESSVRALKAPTLQQIEERVEMIFHQRIDDDQFSECPITFQEIQIVKDTFIRALRAIQHERIEYQQNVLQELGKKSSDAKPQPILSAATSIPSSPELQQAMIAIGTSEVSPMQHHISDKIIAELEAEADADAQDHEHDDEPQDMHHDCFPSGEIQPTPSSTSNGISWMPKEKPNMGEEAQKDVVREELQNNPEL